MKFAPGEPFFNSRWVQPPKGTAELDPADLAPGFRAGAAACGLKGGGATDVGLLVCDAEKVSSAVLLTRNAAAAAPVRVCREDLDSRGVRAAVVNSGNANASTGRQGYADALAMQKAAAEALGVKQRAVAVAETGTIGVPLDIRAVLEGVEAAASVLSPEAGEVFTEAIMTTDASPKNCTVKAGGVTVSAQAKGAGMIEPDMATMLCFIQTDAKVTSPAKALKDAVTESFHRITVDGQMSTNDTVLLQSTGTSGKAMPKGLLEAVLLQLAIAVVSDGEGATRIGKATVRGAATKPEADAVAREIANSPLVKTALYGRDSNWGRIAQAAGKALAGKEMEELGPGRIEARELASDDREAELSVNLGRGKAEAHIYFSDLTPEYISINADYTT
jgi:glutamate N-acetyltransferase / amino-acid N-acetyltransferase